MMRRTRHGNDDGSLSESLLPSLDTRSIGGHTHTISAPAESFDKLSDGRVGDTKQRQSRLGSTALALAREPDTPLPNDGVQHVDSDSWTHDSHSPGQPADRSILSKLRNALSTWDEGTLSNGSARWIVTTMIGKGGSGAVFKAQDVRGRKYVAVKVIEPTSASFTKTQVRQMRREAEAMKQIQDENVCGCLDYTFLMHPGKCSKITETLENGTCTLFVMILEYLDGKTVRQLMHDSPTGRLSEPQTVGVALAMLHGLCRVHEMGLSHKDLKPDNIMRIMVDGNPRYKIIGTRSILPPPSPSCV